MSLFRDSWEVWRRKVNEALGGLVEPVKSEDVTYDNTDSGLTATNVQSAIDEVVTDVSSLSTVVGDADSGLVKDVTGIKNTLTLKSYTGTTTSAGWIISDIEYANRYILTVGCNIAGKFALPTRATDSPYVWDWRIYNNDLTPLASTEVTVYYIEV